MCFHMLTVNEIKEDDNEDIVQKYPRFQKKIQLSKLALKWTWHAYLFMQRENYRLLDREGLFPGKPHFISRYLSKAWVAMATPAFASRYPERKRTEKSPENGMATAWRSIGPSDELTKRPCRRLFAANGKKEDDVALFCYKGKFFAMSAWCSHLGESIFTGIIHCI